MASKAAFVFPLASGHTNPSLPLARRLVALGWEVHYMSFPPFQEAVEDTGAKFNDLSKICDPVTADLFADHSEGQATVGGRSQTEIKLLLALCGAVLPLKYLSGVRAWLQDVQPRLVVYCPHLCVYAHLAAQYLAVPSVALLTLPGPGSFAGMLKVSNMTESELIKVLLENKPHMEALESIKEQCGLPGLTLNTESPLNRDHYSAVNLVTTTRDLQDPMTSEEAAFYEAAGKRFEFVGPLFDIPGAKRCAGFQMPKPRQAGAEPAEGPPPDLADEQPVLHRLRSDVVQDLPMGILERAVAQGRKIMLASLGTIITGDSPEHGWLAADGSAITGQQLCQAVFSALFQEFGHFEVGDEVEADEGEEADARRASIPLLVLAVGPQPDALAGLRVPGNAICRKTVPQLDVLRLKPSLFVTHGGQNSFMESMAAGTPLVVCPGFADQPANGAKAQALGVGLCVDRPPAGCGGEVAAYEAGVRQAIRRVAEGQEYAAAAQRMAQGLASSGGVYRAVEVLLEAAATSGAA